MPQVNTISTTDSFRTWAAVTNGIVDLINANTVVAGNPAYGTMQIGNSSHTNTSLMVTNSMFVNTSVVRVFSNTTFGANVTINATSLLFSVVANATLLQSPGGTFVNGSPLVVNATTTFNGSVSLSATTPLAVGNAATFSSNVTVANNITSSNTFFAKTILFSESGALLANTVSNPQYDNFGPTGISGCMVLHLLPDTQNVTLTGIAAPTNLSVGAKLLFLQNVGGTFKIVIKSENTSSTAANRFKTISDLDVELPPGGSIPLIYTTSTQRWRLLAAPTSSLTTLTLSGAATLGDTLSVAGVATFAANVAFDSNVLFVDAVNNRVGVNISSPTVPLHVVGNTLLGNVAIGGNLAVTQQTTLSNTLAVTGATTLSNTLSLTGAATLLSTLALTGAATLSSTLLVSGATDLRSSLSVNNAMTVNGAATINGTARFDTTAGRVVLPVGVNKYAS